MKNIVIKPAGNGDAVRIQGLLAAEGRWQSLEHINDCIELYTLMLHGNELAAVLCGDAEKMGNTASVTVHPGYPERIIAESVHGLLQGMEMRSASLVSRLGDEEKGSMKCPQCVARTGKDIRVTC